MSLFSIGNARHVLRPDPGQFGSTATGADIMLAAAQMGKTEKACVVIVNHQRFNASATGYDGRIILVNSERMSVPPEAKMPGTELGRRKSQFIPLRPDFAKEFLKSA